MVLVGPERRDDKLRHPDGAEESERDARGLCVPGEREERCARPEGVCGRGVCVAHGAVEEEVAVVGAAQVLLIRHCRQPEQPAG